MQKVLIVGAGPTGLVLAHELIQRGISIRLIDQALGPSTHSKALGIQSRTLEVFERMGILDDFLAKGFKATEVTMHWKGRQFPLKLANIDAPYPFLLILSQQETEQILLKHLEKAGGKVEWQTKLLDIIDDKPLIEHPTGAREVWGPDWIIGCDGAHSQVRHSLKLPFKGTRLPESFLIADVEATASEYIEGPNFFVSPKGFSGIVPLSTNQYRLIFRLQNHEQPLQEKIFLSSLLKERDIHFPLTIHSIMWFSTFQIHRRMTPSFRKGTVFLAGDAAHIHSPAGGQGMNTGIQDAFNLAWKLDLAVQGIASPALLESYESERLPVAKTVLKMTTRLTRLLTIYQKWFPIGFVWILRWVFSNKKLRQKMTIAFSELGIHYPQSPIIKQTFRNKDWKGPKPGERAPDAHLADGSRLFEKFKTTRNHVLLLFANNQALIHGIQQEYGKWVDIFVVNGEEVQKKYAAETNTLYVIRPDGYIGFRSKAFKIEEVVSYFLQLFKPASQRNKL